MEDLSMKKNELVRVFTKAVEDMKTKKHNGTYHWYLDRDKDGNDWAIVLGWSDGFEEDETDDCMSGTYRLCAKVAYQSCNNIMQCDYDIDWTMPYDEESGEVDDTEFSIYPDTDLEEIVDWLLECYNSYGIETDLLF